MFGGGNIIVGYNMMGIEDVVDGGNMDFFEFYNISNNDNEMMKDKIKLSKMQLKVISCSFLSI